MKYRCQECNGTIMINRIDDAEILCKVDDDGSLIELSSRPNGSITIYCEKNNSHKIPQELQDELIDTFYEYY